MIGGFISGVTCAIGMAEYQPDEPFDITIARAAQTLYQVKDSGRNREVRAD